MTTARLAALRAKVQASSKINSQAKAENTRLKLELKEKQEEYEEVLLLKKETLESLSGSMYEAENTQLRNDIAVKEAAILKEMAAIEAMLSEGEEVELPPVPEVKPEPKVEVKKPEPVKQQVEVKPEMNGKKPILPPDDGGAGWCLIEEEGQDPEDENEFFAPEPGSKKGWTWLNTDDDSKIPVEFWGPKTGITQVPDAQWSTHFRVVKR